VPRDDDGEKRRRRRELLRKDGGAQKFAYVDIKSADFVFKTESEREKNFHFSHSQHESISVC
jgi:hypothetical protein